MVLKIETELEIKTEKEWALEQLKRRQEENRGKKKIDNTTLSPGSPMYDYCKSCDGLADVRPERYFVANKKEFCDECQILKDRGWID